MMDETAPDLFDGHLKDVQHMLMRYFAIGHLQFSGKLSQHYGEAKQTMFSVIRPKPN